MIATVTLNTALDRILFVRGFRLGVRMQVDRTLTTMGGKGTNVSLIVRELGGKSLAMGLVGGAAGHQMLDILDASEVGHEFMPANGETRVNTVLVDVQAGKQTTLISETLAPTPEQMAALEERIGARLPQAQVWCFCGSVPPGLPQDTLARLVQQAREAGAWTVLDTSGAALREGLAARPTFIKPNLPELEELVGRSLPSLEHARDAALSVSETGPEWCVASLGELGLVAAHQGGAVHYPALDVPVVSTSGAGDGVVAGIAFGLERGAAAPDAIRLGVATAASVVSQPGTAQCRREDVERLFRAAKPADE